MPSSNTAFEPTTETVRASQLTAFIAHVARSADVRFDDYRCFDAFAVEHYRSFWRLFLEWTRVPCGGSLDPVCVGDRCETAIFFPEVTLNYAEVLLDGHDPDAPALTALHGDRRGSRLTRRDLRTRVAALADTLSAFGIVAGDRVVAVAHNNAEAVIAALATAAIGATFSTCSPDMGAFSILSRVAQLDPVVLFANVEPAWRDAAMPPRVEVTRADIAAIAAALPTLSLVVILDGGTIETSLPVVRLSDVVAAGSDGSPVWVRRRFDQPLCVMFSSGTTGAPKCIVHGAGGTLLEHLKEHRLHCDIRPGDTLFFQTSCAWMMWNWQLSALASGAEIVLYDGPIGNPRDLWRLVEGAGVTLFGTNPPYLRTCIAADYRPAQDFAFARLRGILSTGSILDAHCFDWVGTNVKPVPVQTISGGTDILGCFVLGNPLLPVMRGEAQCRSLALDVRAFACGHPGPIGDLVCANPFPSRPLGFHGDRDGLAFHEAYFSRNPGVWTHGDLIEFTACGGARLHGRSDSLLNIDGNRVGPADVYRILDTIPEVVAAAAVEQARGGRSARARLVLLVVLRSGLALDATLDATIRRRLRTMGTASFVPAKIVQVDALPTTFNGKLSEAAVRAAVNGRVPANLAALNNPECLLTIGRIFAT